jgi:LysM repeat protein
MPEAAHSPARFLAPLALVVCVVAFFGVILSSGAGDDDSSNTGQPAGQSGSTQQDRTSTQPTRPQRRNYTVKTGDTLGGIAEKTGVDVERLQELNPELDPQALVAGQKIKLRE